MKLKPVKTPFANDNPAAY